MAIICMHLRWDDLSAEQHRVTRRALDDLQEESGSGCHSSSSRSAGDALLATLVWEDEESASRFTQGRLADLVTTGHMAEPQTVRFAVPAVFAAGYRRKAGHVPAPRPAAERAVRQREYAAS